MQHHPELTYVERVKLLSEAFIKWRETMEKALSHGPHTHTVDDIFAMCMANNLQFYDFDDCFIIMEVILHPKLRSYHAFLTGGNMESILDKEPMMMEIARVMNCTVLTAAGREGWQRVFKKRGWDFFCVTMYKEVPNG